MSRAAGLARRAKEIEPDDTFVVKGTKCVSATASNSIHKPPSSLAPKKVNSVFGSTKKSVRITTQSPTGMTSSSSLKRAVSHSALNQKNTGSFPAHTHTSSIHIHSTPSSSGNSYSPERYQETPGICNCQHPADMSFLKEAYVRNLGNHIRVLELENQQLKESGGGYKGMSREDTVTVGRPSSSTYAAWPFTSTEPRYPQPLPPTSTSGQNKRPELRKQPTPEDERLFLRLEESIQREQMLDDCLKQQENENQKLARSHTEAVARVEELTDRLNDIEVRATTERRQLLEENKDLQHRIDELTPVLADKQAQIAKLQLEKDSLGRELRSTKSELRETKNRIEDQKREESVLSELDSERKHEIDRLREKLKQVENEVDNMRLRETRSKDELRDLQQRVKEEASASRRLRQENETLSKDHASCSSQIARLEDLVQIQREELESKRYGLERESEISELRQMEQNLKSEVIRLEDRLKREEDTSRTLRNQLKSLELTEAGSRQELLKTQKELEGLEALSHSLTNENTGLREEKIALTEQIEFLQKRRFQLSDKEAEIQDLEEALEVFKQKYAAATSQLQRDLVTHSERKSELEAIVQKAHRLSESLPSKSSQARSSSLMTRRVFANTAHLSSSSVVSVDTVTAGSTVARPTPNRIADRYSSLRD